jgi:hypothetical protein
MGQMLYVLKHSGCRVYELKTDSVLYSTAKRKRPELNTLRYADLSTLRERHEPALKRTKRLDQHCELSTTPSQALVFRVEAAKEEDRMKSNGPMPRRNWKMNLASKVYTRRTQEEGERVVMQGGSLQVCGVAGTGKSHYCKILVERLRAAGKRVDVLAKTHTASSNAGGCTLDHWCHRHILNGTPSCDVLFVDEISQIGVGSSRC